MRKQHILTNCRLNNRLPSLSDQRFASLHLSKTGSKRSETSSEKVGFSSIKRICTVIMIGSSSFCRGLEPEGWGPGFFLGKPLYSLSHQTNDFATLQFASRSSHLGEQCEPIERALKYPS